MRRWLRGLGGVRVRVGHLVLISLASAAVSALIVASALRESPAERAVTAALRTRQIVRASTPVIRPAGSTAAGVAAGTPSPAVSQSAPDTSGEIGTASTSSPSSGGGSPAASGAGPAAPGAGVTTSATTPRPTPVAPVSRVKHVFVITLAASSYREVFGPGSVAHYLNATLRPRGELLRGYRTLGQAWLPDLVAMVSGQAPNADTEGECTNYSEFPAGTSAGAQGLVAGAGCVYPNTLLTLGDQLDSTSLRWRAYIDGMTTACEHPDSGAAEAADGSYLPSRNPFIYFHSLLDLGDCQSDDLPLARLAGALTSASRTPRLAFIAADPCDAGTTLPSPTPPVAGLTAAPTTPTCPASPTGVAAADAFLRAVVPGILRSPAYKRDGALLIVFTGPGAGTGGQAPVHTGALVLSRFTRPGSSDGRPYGPFSVLRTLEDIYGLTPLGRAAGAHGFDKTTFTR